MFATRKYGDAPVADALEVNFISFALFVVKTEEAIGNKGGWFAPTSAIRRDFVTPRITSCTNMVSLSKARSIIEAGNLSPVVKETNWVSGRLRVMEIFVVVGTGKKIVTLPPIALFAPETE